MSKASLRCFTLTNVENTVFFMSSFRFNETSIIEELLIECGSSVTKFEILSLSIGTSIMRSKINSVLIYLYFKIEIQYKGYL